MSLNIFSAGKRVYSSYYMAVMFTDLNLIEKYGMPSADILILTHGLWQLSHPRESGLGEVAWKPHESQYLNHTETRVKMHVGHIPYRHIPPDCLKCVIGIFSGVPFPSRYYLKNRVSSISVMSFTMKLTLFLIFSFYIFIHFKWSNTCNFFLKIAIWSQFFGFVYSDGQKTASPRENKRFVILWSKWMILFT